MNLLSDKRLHQCAEEACRITWERFYDKRTHLFYDYLSSYEPEHRFEHLPTPHEIHQSYPNPNGWGTGMEDSTISAGVLISTICDRYEATRDPSLKEPVDRIFDGLVLCSTLSHAKGLVLRSVSPLDGQSYYPESSRDQYTWHAYGLWRFFHSPLASDFQRMRIAEIMTNVCERLACKVVPGETDYHICQENDEPGLVDKMWEVAPHEVARLPMIYAIGWDLTGNQAWWDLYRRYAWQAAEESIQVPLEMRTPFALLQEQVSLEPLYFIENKDLELKAAWLDSMFFVANRVEAITWQCLEYHPLDISTLEMDWRSWPRQQIESYQVPQRPSELRDEDRCLREPAEAQIVQLFCPNRPLSVDQLEILRRIIGQVDYSTCVNYGLFYAQAAYWRAVRSGLFGLP